VADGNDSDDVYVCIRCIGDTFLKQEILRDGRDRECDFCGKTRKAWPLDELAERTQGVIEEHFQITPNDPRDEGFVYDKEMNWERRGYPIADVIAEIANLKADLAEAVRERLSEKTSYDAFESGDEDPFGSDTYYEEGRPDTHGFRESWEFFRQEVRTRSRFFGRDAQRALDEIFGDLGSLKTWEGTPAIKEILVTDEARFLYRARIAYSESELRDILLDPAKRLGPPPSRDARAGRMNAAGISVFYGATDGDTCTAEVRAPVGSYVVLGRFEIIRPVRVLDLDVLTKVMTAGSWFDPEFATRSNRAAFLRHLVEEISRPIMPRDEEFEYLPTQAVSEYLASCVEPRLDGLIFHSAQTAREGRNVVLFHHAASVEPYALPKGTRVEVNMGWASEDDHDDSIAIWETVPPAQPEEQKSSAKPAVSFETILANFPRDEVSDEWDGTGQPTLRLDIQKIEIFRIKSVSYQKDKRSVWRHRHSADEKLPI
jgi:RES domain/HEPN/RES N-terminal domain 1